MSKVIEIETMLVLCAWCTKYLRGNKQSDVVSHGICQMCLEKYFPVDEEVNAQIIKELGVRV